MRRRALIVLLLATGWSLVPAGPASACSCAGFTDAAAFETAGAVFTGTLVDVQPPEDAPFQRSTAPQRFVFEVDRVYKGDVRARQTVVTPQGGESCGLELVGAGPFLVFANEESGGLTSGAVDGELYANLCGGSRALGQGVPAAFGPGDPPIRGSSPGGTPDHHDGRPAPVLVAGAALVVVAVAGAAAVRRRTAAAPRAPSPG